MAAEAQLIITGQNRTGPEVNRLIADLNRISTASDRTSREVVKQERQLDRLASSAIYAARTSGDYSSALRISTAQLDGAERGTERYNRVLAQQIRLETQAARAARLGPGVTPGPILPRSIEGFGPTAIKQVGQLAAALGGAALAAQAAQAAIRAIGAANSLEKTTATVRALAGSEAEYTRVLALARQQQLLYGGSLQSQLDGLRGLIPLARNAGVSLDALSTAAKQLAFTSPEQGIAGAAFALREFLASDNAEALISLADRFELNKSALKAIKAAGGDASTQIAALSRLLDQQGATAANVAAASQTTANSYDRLGAAALNARDNVGSFLAKLGEPVANAATGVLTIGDRLAAFRSDVVASADTYDAYSRRVDTANQLIARGGAAAASELLNIPVPSWVFGYTSQLEKLTPAQYAFVRALQAQGVVADQAITQAQGVASTAGLIASAVGPAATQLNAMAPALLQAASASDAHRTSIDALIVALNFGYLTSEQFAAQIGELTGRQAEAAIEGQRLASVQAQIAAATETARSAAAAHIDAINGEALAQAQAAVHTEEVTQAKARLEAQARVTVEALLAAGDAGAATAARLAASASPIDQLTAAYYRLAAAQAAVGAEVRSAEAAAANLDRGRNKAAEAVIEEQRLRRERDKVNAALQDRVRQTGSYAQKIALVQDELSKLKPGTEAYTRKETELIALRRAGAAEAEAANKRAASAGAKLARQQERDAAKAQREAEVYAERLERAKDALRTDEQKLASRKEQLAGSKNEAERLELTKEIADLEDRIAETRRQAAEDAIRQQRAAIDAALAQIEDTRQTRAEDRELRQLQAVVNNMRLSQEQRDAAAERIKEIELERQKRQLDLADRQREAGSAAATPTGQQSQSAAQGSGAKFGIDTPVVDRKIALPPDRTTLPVKAGTVTIEGPVAAPPLPPGSALPAPPPQTALPTPPPQAAATVAPPAAQNQAGLSDALLQAFEGVQLTVMIDGVATPVIAALRAARATAASSRGL